MTIQDFVQHPDEHFEFIFYGTDCTKRSWDKQSKGDYVRPKRVVSTQLIT